jgi:2-furoyl-CoA dehydrogenase large subunit
MSTQTTKDPPQGGSGPAVRARALCRRSAGAGRYSACPCHPLAARARRNRSIDAAKALDHPGVWAVITGEEVRKLSDPFLAAVKTPVQQWSLRSSGCAMSASRWRWWWPRAAISPRTPPNWSRSTMSRSKRCSIRLRRANAGPLLHPEAKTNEVSVRDFCYGNTEAAFARADHRITMTTTFPRLSFTPIECYVVVAQHNPAKAATTCWRISRDRSRIHPVMARALRVPGRNCGCVFRRIPAAASASSCRCSPMSC